MGPLRRIVAAVISTTALVGCALISGAGDLSVGPLDDNGGAPEASAADLDGASTSDGTQPGLDGGQGPTDGGTTDARTPGDGGDAGSRLREVTFEDGTLLGLHGGDSMFGNNAFLVTGSSALSGNNSMRADKSVSGVQVDFAAVTELYTTVLVRFENLGFGPSVLIEFMPEAAGAFAELRVDSGNNSPLVMLAAGSIVGMGGAVNEGASPYRLGVHLRHDASSSFLEVFLGSQGAPFGAPFISTTITKLGRTVGVRISLVSNVGGSNTRAVFDDLLLDTASMPPP